MRKAEAYQRNENMNKAAALGLGVLLSLGAELLILLIGSIAASAGVFKADSALQVTVAACLIGCFFGGSFTCKAWGTRRLVCGILTGLSCFLIIVLAALISSGSIDFNGRCFGELAGCLLGGALAGIAGSRKKKKRRKSR